jgi:hypothetical protein
MIRIEIKTDNAAFRPDCRDEIVRILQDLVERFGRGPLEQPIRDINGNTVGSVSIVNCECDVCTEDHLCSG